MARMVWTGFGLILLSIVWFFALLIYVPTDDPQANIGIILCRSPNCFLLAARFFAFRSAMPCYGHSD